MFALISLGFTLSLDNFRSSLVLGGLKPTFRESVKTSAIFGLWDGVTPLIGIIIGAFLSNKIAGTADTIAIIGLGVYSPWLAPILFGIITFGMSVAGHQVGRTVASVVDFVPRINTDLLTGIGFFA